LREPDSIWKEASRSSSSGRSAAWTVAGCVAANGKQQKTAATHQRLYGNFRMDRDISNKGIPDLGENEPPSCGHQRPAVPPKTLIAVKCDRDCRLQDRRGMPTKQRLLGPVAHLRLTAVSGACWYAAMCAARRASRLILATPPERDRSEVKSDRQSL
jgi:hypothetical protein